MPHGERTEELTAEVIPFTVWTGDTESDPMAVGHWRIELSTAGVTLERYEVPAADRETCAVTWAELHAVLGNRMALIEEIPSLEYERDWLAEDVRRLRNQVLRLKSILAAREAKLTLSLTPT